MTDDDLVAELERLLDLDQRPPPPADPVLRAALALEDHYGLWRDPVLTPDTLIEMAQTALKAAAVTPHQPPT